MANFVQGGAAGSEKGPGYVYVLEDRHEGQRIFKIGQAKDVEVRLGQIRNQRGGGHENAVLLKSFWAAEANLAETLAQKAVKAKLKMEKCPYYGGATDWFLEKKNVSQRRLLQTVEKAVQWFNEQEPGLVYILGDTTGKLLKIRWVKDERNMDVQGHSLWQFFYVLRVRLAIGVAKRAVVSSFGLPEKGWYKIPRGKTIYEFVVTIRKAVEVHNNQVLAAWS